MRPGWQELANFRKPYKTSRTRAAPGGRRAIPRSQPQVGSREYVVRFFGVRRVSRRGGFHLSQFERPDTAGLVRRRLAENAQDVDALFVLAAIQARAGRLAEGLTILDHVLRLDPTYPGAWRFKALLHRMKGEDDAERAARERAEGRDE